MSTEPLEGEARVPAAWRLLAALEGGALALAAGAALAWLLQRSLRARLARSAPVKSCKSVLISNDSPLGKEIRSQLESRGCTVHTVASGVAGGAASGAGEPFDALVMVGADAEDSDLTALANTVADDINVNLKLLENLITNVRRGGKVFWASTHTRGTASGAFSEAGKALGAVIQAQLNLVADRADCEAVWLGRCGGAESAAKQVLLALYPHERYDGVINTAVNVGAYIGRWLKGISSK